MTHKYGYGQNAAHKQPQGICRLKMASLRGESSNQLLETLEEWNDYLERFPGARPASVRKYPIGRAPEYLGICLVTSSRRSFGTTSSSEMPYQVQQKHRRLNSTGGFRSMRRILTM
jgi:hypothetical protein